jgi:hypothetical protein
MHSIEYLAISYAILANHVNCGTARRLISDKVNQATVAIVATNRGE